MTPEEAEKMVDEEYPEPTWQAFLEAREIIERGNTEPPPALRPSLPAPAVDTTPAGPTPPAGA